MSLILEALRKSEAERRRGQVPGLYSEPVPGVPSLRSATPSRLWLAIAIGVAALIALASWFARPAAPPAPSAVDPPVAATAGEGSTRALIDDARPGDEAIGNVSSTDTRGDRAVADAIPTTPPLPSDETGAAAMPQVQAAAATASSPAPAPPTERSVEPAAPDNALADTDVLPPVPAPAEARIPAPDAPAATGTPATPAAAPGAAPLRLSDLSGDQRQQLPPLKMSMHMWSPTQQFAIIDGSRVARGDRVGPAIVDEINATGVVLEWQGQRLQIPIR